MSVFKGAIKKTKMRKNTFAQKLIIPPKPETAFLMLVIYFSKRNYLVGFNGISSV